MFGIKTNIDSNKIKELLARRIEAVFPSVEYAEEELKSGKKLRVYLGIDPTGPSLHLGHTIPLLFLKQLLELGHRPVLLIGDFTARIGDPTGKETARKPLTKKEIKENMKDYLKQAYKILPKGSFDVKYNSSWLSNMSFDDVIRLSAHVTVQQMIIRDMFQERLKNGKSIGVHEFLYPLMQGYDSVAMDVDLEVGGKDQVPNMMDGRTLVNVLKKHEKWVLGTRLIEDPNGKKMGKTEGNIVNISDLPEVKYEGIMTWPDSAIPMGFELITSVPMEQVWTVGEMLQKGELNPVQTKEALAYRVVLELDGDKEAQFAKEEFDLVKRQGKLPRRMNELTTIPGVKVSNILVDSGLVKTPEEAAAKIAQKSVFIDGKQLEKESEWPSSAETVALGKKTIKNIRRVVLV